MDKVIKIDFTGAVEDEIGRATGSLVESVNKLSQLVDGGCRITERQRQLLQSLTDFANDFICAVDGE